jgi:hypothetical protein
VDDANAQVTAVVELRGRTFVVHFAQVSEEDVDKTSDGTWIWSFPNGTGLVNRGID